MLEDQGYPEFALEKTIIKTLVIEITSSLYVNLQRHRLVNECLAAELRNEVHALRIDAVPPSKFDGSPAAEAPKCMGGAKR